MTADKITDNGAESTNDPDSALSAIPSPAPISEPAPASPTAEPESAAAADSAETATPPVDPATGSDPEPPAAEAERAIAKPEEERTETDVADDASAEAAADPAAAAAADAAPAGDDAEADAGEDAEAAAVHPAAAAAGAEAAADDEDGLGSAGAEPVAVLVEEERRALVLSGAVFAHAPTTGRADGLADFPVDADYPYAGAYPDVPEAGVDDLDEDDFETEPVIVGFDRRPDFGWWLGTPIFTLVLAPMLAGVLTFFVSALSAGYPRICLGVEAENGCEEAVLRMAGEHTVVFLALWLGLWALPWWRGLRRYRIVLAAAAFAVLLFAPLRLLGT
ncbi:hypothetical protein [Paractinoplanes durhamensis]|uniref:Uncharacterized protein n=1 Tax=Paractinoplanes durhamensis TaxID=113563 RepID=A0ABQ3Z5N0_9ACTN|nr:hypothetical protein [Actinoplanes durhamensis]GIE04859.1 hypothetical protein Adu01nite_62090 [Actinoplanes durhamensis]